MPMPMPVPLTQETAMHWPYQPSSSSIPGQVTADSHSHPQLQPNQFDWLIGDLDVPAPRATWVRYPNKPYIEEFVPPNPPQALGEGREKMLTWPTATMCRDPMWNGANNVQQQTDGQDQSSPTGYQSFFRRQMLKQNQGTSENGKVKTDEEVSKNDVNRHRDISQEFWDLFDHDERAPSMGTTSSDSFRARSSGNSLGKRQRGHVGSLPPGCSTQRVMIHVQNPIAGHTSTLCRDCDLPDNLTSQLPRLLRPSSPEQLKATLATLTPMIVYAEFTCSDVCRTRGICVHYSFVLGCKKAPDGLICQICQTKGNEKAVHAERLCARHNNSKLSSFTMNLAEDILATEMQSLRAYEILARSSMNYWDGVPEKTLAKAKSDVPGQKTSTLPIRTVDRQAADCDIAVSSIETVPGYEEQVVKKIRVDDQNGEVKLSENTYNNAEDVVQFR